LKKKTCIKSKDKRDEELIGPKNSSNAKQLNFTQFLNNAKGKKTIERII
jgi:hypothetical protein